MEFVFYTNSVSPHQVPLAKELVALLGADEYRYIYTKPLLEERRGIGWGECAQTWLLSKFDHEQEATRLLENCRVLMSGIRDIPLFEKRAEKGLWTIYSSERWFKPPLGMFRLFSPRYYIMAWRLGRLLAYGEKFMAMPMGIYAVLDLIRICGIANRDSNIISTIKNVECKKEPGGSIKLVASQIPTVNYVSKLRLWGYFVEPSNCCRAGDYRENDAIRILWVGRMLDWKRVDTLIKAVKLLLDARRCKKDVPRVVLNIYGRGKEEPKLKRLSGGYENNIHFHKPVPIHCVRELMRVHDIYVLPSNGYEGWGAVVNEALEEGMKVVGTYEAGATATILPEENLYHCGDHKELARKIISNPIKCGIGKWSVRNAAHELIDIIKGLR